MDKYQVTEQIKLSEINTNEFNKKAEKKLEKLRQKISKVQEKMYAEGKYAALICLQGMDTSGKDSLIREVFKEVNVSGVEVHSFKVPTEKELNHDYLWRHYIALPEKGKIGIFNRTHYENVLVTRVHPEYIFSENIPSIKNLEDINSDFFDNRMEEINNFEKSIAHNGTIILKFFLNLSKDEQKNRLLRRLRLKKKNWKFSKADLKERKLWDNYQFCYEELLNKTSKPHAPWFVIPADDKPTARLLVAEIILETLKKYNFQEPILADNSESELDDYRNQLENE